MPENDPATATPETPAAPKYVTAEEVAKTVNAALTSHFKRQPDVSKLITESFAQYEARKAEEAAAKQAEGGGDGTKKVDPELLKLQRQIADQEKAIAKERSAREAAESATRNQSANTAIEQALAKHGVRPEAVARLAKAYRADVTFDEVTGEPLLPVEGGTTTIAAAIEADVKSKALDYAIQAPSGGGSGTARQSRNGANSIESIQAKPRNQWTKAEEDAVLAERIKRASA